MYSSYEKLGTNCIEQTIAYTSNEKFLKPINPIYFQPFTRVNIPPEEQKVKTLEDKKYKEEPSSCKSCSS